MADINLNIGSDDLQELKKVLAEIRKEVDALKKSIAAGGGIVTDEDVNKAKKLAVEQKKIENELNKQTLAGQRIQEQQDKFNQKAKESEGIIGGLTNKANQLRSELKSATSTSQIKKLQTELNGVNAALQRAKGTTATWGKALGSFQFKFNALGNIAANVVQKMTQTLKVFVKESLAAYDKEIKAERQLLVAMEGRVTATNRLIAQAKLLQKITLFGDDETVRAQALIAAFVTEEKAIKRIIPLVQDFAQGKQMDLASAADLVAKTLGSTTNALQRHGVAVEGAVGSSERLESLTIGLTKAFGGQAEAAALVDANFTQLKNRIGDLQESLGGFISDMIFMSKVQFSLFGNAKKGWETISVAEAKAGKEMLTFMREYKDIDSAALALTAIIEKQNELEGAWKAAHTAAATAKKKDYDAAKQAYDEINDQKEAYKLLIPEIESYISTLGKVPVGLTEAQLKALLDQEAAYIRMERLLRTMADIDAGGPAKRLAEALSGAGKGQDLGDEFWEEWMAGFDFVFEESDKQQKEWLDKRADNVSKEVDKEVKEYKRGEKEKKDILDTMDAAEKAAAERRKQITADTFTFASRAATTFANLFEAQKQKELSMVGDNAVKREQIEKAYAKKQQNIAMISAIINTAEGIVKVLSDYGLPWGLIPAAAMAALGAAEISTIKSQKFAEGGPVIGEPHSRGGVNLEAEGGEYIINKRSTGKYKSLIDAINQDDQARIMDAMGRDRKIIIKQVDPYTEKMYNLMKAQVQYGEDNEYYYKHKGNMLIKTKKN